MKKTQQVGNDEFRIFKPNFKSFTLFIVTNNMSGEGKEEERKGRKKGRRRKE
jgi:hypothetical protein